jgi:hypothetical protein
LYRPLHPVKIPSLTTANPFSSSGSSSNTRRPANIPLHTLSRASRDRRDYDAEDDGAFDEKEARQRLRRSGSFGSDDAGSEFSLWSDTGDLVDQLAEEEDPLAARVRGTSFEVDRCNSHKRGRSGQQPKRVRYASDNGHGEKHAHPGVVRRKEDIRIPTPPPRRLNWGEKLLAAVMAPGDGPSRMHGLHGKKLIYFLSIFVSLGVFLFGYGKHSHWT